ncbi:MAG: hypothetical protein D6694_04695 [Gammaproteobacteria bacterium]|nr:MAG: hypothetical protein D6694_04695 [Gammaproteobacteria bacterium]
MRPRERQDDGKGNLFPARLGRSRPSPQPRVAEWERGERSPRRPIRRACAPIAARAVAEMATEDERLRAEIVAAIEALIV